MELTVQEVFNKFGNNYLDMYTTSYNRLNVYNNISTCRTKKQGLRGLGVAVIGTMTVTRAPSTRTQAMVMRTGPVRGVQYLLPIMGCRGFSDG